MYGRKRRSCPSSSSTPTKRKVRKYKCALGGDRGGDRGGRGPAQVPGSDSSEIQTQRLEFIEKDLLETTVHSLCKEMLPRYKKRTSIGRMKEDDPLSYCYVDDCSHTPSLEDHHWVCCHDQSELRQVIPHEYKNAWKSLAPEKGQVLLVMLSVFRSLERILEFQPVGWREKYPVSLDGDSDETQGPDLLSYGDPDPSGKTLLQLLQGSKSKEEITQDIAPYRPQLNLNFVFWHDALLKQMTNSAARAALTNTFDFINMLLKNMPESMVPAHCLPIFYEHFTSPTPNDGFSVSDCGHKAVSRCCSASRSRSCSRSVSQEGRKRTSSSSSKTNSRSYPDIAVVCADRKKREAKYVLLVKIHELTLTPYYSHSNSASFVIGKFKKELVHVLQGQTEVFGLLIRYDAFHFFRAERLKSQTISISETSHKLYRHPFSPDSDFVIQLDVKSLQELVMHLFSCFVYGMSCIKISQ